MAPTLRGASSIRPTSPVKHNGPTHHRNEENGSRARRNALGTHSVYLQLKNLIISCRFRPEQQLHPSELAERFRVSSTPVREALQRLAAEELIIAAPNRGFFSKALDVEEVRGLCRLHSVLVKYAIESTYTCFEPQPQVSKKWFDIIGRESAIEMASATLSSTLEHLLLNIAIPSSNRPLVSMIENFNDRTHFIRVLDLERPSRRQEIMTYVSTLLDQLSNGRVTEALRILNVALDRELDLVPSLVKEALIRSYDAGTSGYSDTMR